ncbi:TPA: VWA domain-containing protein [Candidatus Woesearchaeota archaeon]|nr:VWA domain-containing protein [Candidatus Woesearchaeota archaeon]HIH32201.1 VWA domain-containing protein [Candidatus Woesearchaeota archaeon]HIH55588.1 VWA domain-containing protein [Candidatus Woesearchaeota archaeon]HIJ02560.1 VWA domain-containing protein [Candidatus Woesearchaeota archaeon]HIJ13394.1 VWA domain-containing protein [Candidatus Woesearchaeota archaeon]
MKREINKKIPRNGYYFIFDALFAAILLVSGLIVLSQYSGRQNYVNDIDFISKDLLSSLSSIRIYEYNESYRNNSFIVSELNNGDIVNPQNTVLEQIGEYWARDEIDKARTLISEVLKDVNLTYNIEISALNAYRTEYDILYLNNLTDSKKDLISSRRMISGIEKGKPLSGSSSSAYLKKVLNKKIFSYAYFGGFIGQGNITVPLTLLEDYNSSRLMYAVLKISTPGNFTLYINDQQCLGVFNGTNNISSDAVLLWNVTSCRDFLKPNTNNVSIRFIGELSTSFVAGGFFKASYSTDSLTAASQDGYKRYYFPDIYGIINLYDAISAQGIIQNWTLNLTFYNNYSTYFNFGNDTLFMVSGNDTIQNLVFYGINQNLPEKPIPIRLGIQNFSNVTRLNYGVSSDIFLITDVSGSMGECIGSVWNCTYQYQKLRNGQYFPISCIVNNQNLCNGNPDNPCGGAPFYRGRNYATNCNQSRLDVAQAADINFVNSIFNNSLLHNIGLVDFSSSAHAITSLTSNAALLINEINTYVASGATCSCCGINRAKDALMSSANKKYLIFLSDGDPTYYCKNLSDYEGSSVWGGDFTGGSSSELDRNWTILAGQDACNDNITVYTIGFGTGMSAQGIDTMMRTACNSSLYYNATDTSQLDAIFRNISRDVALSANFSSQTVIVTGNYTPSRLYGTSYIDIYYDAVIDNISQANKISVARESSQFNGCKANVFIPSDVEVTEAFVTSYSGNYWTKNLTVNDFLVFNLADYGAEYGRLGDPFLIEVPSVIVQSGEYSNITITVGDNNTDIANCSNNNTFIYTFLVNSTVSRSSVLSGSQGCNWTIQFDDGSISNSLIPTDYNGNYTCYYNTTGVNYKNYDAYDVSVYDMLDQLDFDNDGRVDINLEVEDLEVIVTSIESVPYLWGPSIIEIRAWK